MRLKKIKGAEEKIKESKYIIQNPRDYKGKYSSLFNNDNDIEIEIGMGKGTFIINKAKQNPNINYIGIEKFDSVIVRAVEKLENENLENLKLIKMDAEEINEIFQNEIDLIYLNFSDPWPKKRHSKRRLTSDSFLNLYNKISKNNINIKMKTDNKDLFAYSIMTYNNYGFKIKDISLDLPEDYENNVVTEYERKFRNQGITINYINVVKEVKYEE